MSNTDGNQKCPYCGQGVRPWEMSVKDDDGDICHIDCYAKVVEDAFFDRDMELGA